MLIDDVDYHKLIDSLKRTSRLIDVIKHEKEKVQVNRVCQVILDELQRMTEDMNEIKKAHEKEEL